jgi:hypothetical protein
MKLTTSAQMRELDRQAIEDRGIPSIGLMERAAKAGGRRGAGIADGPAGPVHGGGAVRRREQRRGRHRRGAASVFEGCPGPGVSGGQL